VVGAEISLATAALLHSTCLRLAHVATSIAAVHRSRGEAGVFVAAGHRHAEDCDDDAKTATRFTPRLAGLELDLTCKTKFV
jgi:hypothetical protein